MRRINFKIGQTKKSYALIDAEVTLWQESENSWGARIKAAPVRTDFNLTDTGLLLINATWQRAASLHLTPVQITAQWEKGQLGQITKLLSGKDRGMARRSYSCHEIIRNSGIAARRKRNGNR